jgi:hypothetical protein
MFTVQIKGPSRTRVLKLLAYSASMLYSLKTAVFLRSFLQIRENCGEITARWLLSAMSSPNESRCPHQCHITLRDDFGSESAKLILHISTADQKRRMEPPPPAHFVRKRRNSVKNQKSVVHQSCLQQLSADSYPDTKQSAWTSDYDKALEALMLDDGDRESVSNLDLRYQVSTMMS